MLDKDLFFAENQRSVIFPGAGWNPGFFPSTLAPNYWDMLAVLDLARGSPVYANFRVAAAFDNVAANLMRFAVFTDSDPSFINTLTDPSLTIARSHDMTSTWLSQVGIVVRVALPPVSDLALLNGSGRRYLCLGFEASVPTTDWSTGGIDAFLSNRPLPASPLSLASGY